jgi:hypothetical protein
MEKSKFGVSFSLFCPISPSLLTITGFRHVLKQFLISKWYRIFRAGFTSVGAPIKSKYGGLYQDRDQWGALVNTVMNLLVPLNSGNFLSGCSIGSFSRRAQLH